MRKKLSSICVSVLFLLILLVGAFYFSKNNISKYVLEAEIVKIDETSFLIKREKNDMLIRVPKESFPEIERGDIGKEIEVIYNGMILETAPARFEKIEKITFKY